MAAELSRPTPLIMVAGIYEEPVAATASALCEENPQGTAVVHHDLRQIMHGVVRRMIRRGDEDEVTVLELAHGCVSCTLREDLLPLLRRLSQVPEVERIIVQLDPALQPETICWAIHHVLVDERPVLGDVRIQAVITAVDLPHWLGELGAHETLAERGLRGSPGDERTLAEISIGQVEFADAIVFHGTTKDRWQTARTEAVINRLTPGAPLVAADALDVADLLKRIPADARRGLPDGHHGALLRGQPSFEVEAGVSLVFFEERRPFHPQRLHDALNVLLDGVVRMRGRAWVASQPDVMLWLESAAHTLAVGHAGPWLAAQPRRAWEHAGPEQQLRASLNWDGYWGDRMQELVMITHEISPRELTRALRRALLTDEELAAGRREWLTYDDPFGEWHTDPCGERDETSDIAESRRDGTS